MATPKTMWKPTEAQIENANMTRFIKFVNKKYNKELTCYGDLYEWSVNSISDFWAAMWDFLEIKAARKYDRVVDDETKMPGAKWFEGALLNFAENLLRYRDDRVALIFKGESLDSTKMTYAQLYDNVSLLAQALKEEGVKPGDRVVGFIPNMPGTIIAMLASVSLGATWSSCSPDFGLKGVFDRFGQVRPKILFAGDGYFFKGRKIDSLKVVGDIMERIPQIEKVIVMPYTEARADISAIPNAVHYDDFIAGYTPGDIAFEQLPSDHPLYIMYSSGTTGLPKCMVQSAAGIIINQMKELVLHTDLTRDDTLFYFTTCGWMMWNWLTCALSTGATIVLYDGNPFYPDPGALWKMAQDEKITVFGTSAGYLAALETAGMKPNTLFDLKSVRTILSTGSPLSPEQFDFVYESIHPDVQLASISGGSDLNGCFCGGNPISPVYRGELQCRCLGMKVKAYGSDGRPVENEQGELVCEAAFPAMPIYFWDDPDGEKYHQAYFDVYPDIWRHGDYIEITETGGVVIYGRSDATLNPGGVRIGTAEIYRRVEQIDEIEDSLVVGQNWQNDVRVILFVKLKPDVVLTDELQDRIRKDIRANASPRHVPAKIIQIPDIPYTLNMKKVELAVKKVIHGKEVKNKDSLSNPESLDYYENMEELTT